MKTFLFIRQYDLGRNMKKYFLGLLFLAGFTFATTNVLAVTCETYGISTGTQCNKKTLQNRTNQAIYVGCLNTNNCVFVNCNGSCSCADNGICESMADHNLRCKSNPVWDTVDKQVQGVYIGHCEAVEAGVGNITVYTCDDGYFTVTNTYNDIWEGYMYSKPVCTPCHWHPDDINKGSGKPSYATTGGKGINAGLKSCKIKSGTKITTNTGTLEITSECPYISEF